MHRDGRHIRPLITLICLCLMACLVSAADGPSRQAWIVTWGDDVGRFNSDLGYATHRQRWARVPGHPDKPPFPDAPLEYFETNADGDGDPARLDLDSDGRTDDDYVAAIRFSLDKPLSTPPWPRSGAYPDPICGRFYGGYTWMVSNAHPRTHPVYTEIGINADHHWPYSDGRADDLPLKGMASQSPDSWHYHYLLHLWKKEDFLNVDAGCRVSLDAQSRLAVMVNRYWVGFNEVRFVVRQGSDFYISQESFADLAAGDELPKTFVLDPTETRWARYHPRAPYDVAFDADKADFARETFPNVTAVGWYLAKTTARKGLSHTKWYSFEAQATIHYPPGFVSPHVKTTAVQAGEEIPGFHISRTEVPYRLWKRVYRWAEMPTYIHAPRFHFRKDGDLGSCRRGAGPHNQDEPVTNITLHDAAAWCNALSELEGRTPCYYTDRRRRRVFRFDELTTRYEWARGQARHLENPRYMDHLGREISPLGSDQIPLPTLYVRWDADGYRLPTASEWLEAYRQGRSNAVGWDDATANRTRPVNDFPADSLGLRGMLGNAWEPVWTWGDSFEPSDDTRMLLLGGGPDLPRAPTRPGAAASPYGDKPFDGAYNIGLRLVCREPNQPAPRQADTPQQPGAQMTVGPESAPTWVVGREARTGRHRKPEAPRDVVELKSVPAGGYLINQDQWHEREIRVSAFQMSTFAITYDQWRRVRHWAQAHGYRFDRGGDLGSCYWSSDTNHSVDEPVTRVSLWDAMVFCNALSEIQGLKPCYYVDAERTEPLRKAFLQRPPRRPPPDYGAQPNYMPWVFVNWAADGYRLPTSPEYLSAISGENKRLPRHPWGESFEEMDNRVWHMFSRNADGSWAGKTHGSAETRTAKTPNPLGLYDLVGNVYELCWSTQPGRDATRHPLMDLRNPKYSRFWMYGHERFARRLRGRGTTFGTSWRWGLAAIKDATGPGTHQFGGGSRDEAMPDTGFRVVRCRAGTHPVDGAEPLKARTVLDYDPADYDPLAGQTHRYSLKRNAVFPGAGVPESPEVAGAFATPGPVRSSPVVVDGIVYFGARADANGKGGAFYAVDARTMEPVWQVPVDGGADGSACVHRGSVYFGGRDGKLYAVTAGAQGGKVRWAVETGRETMDSPPGVAYDTVFVLNGGYGGDAGIKGFTTDTGRMAYLYPAHPYGRSAVCLTPHMALCLHTAADRVYAARLRDEMPAWTGSLLSHSRNDVVVADQTVYAVMGGGMIGGFNKPGQIGAFDLATGRRHWWRPMEAHVNQQAYCFSSPVVWGGRIFVGMDNGYMHVYNATTGEPLAWRVRVTDDSGKPTAIRTSPSVSRPNGTVYFGAMDGRMLALNGRTGQMRWRLQLERGPIESSVWVDGQALFVGTGRGLVKIGPSRP